MATRRAKSRSRRSSARPVRAAAARAVDQVLSSEESFALLIRRLERAGWRIERPAPSSEPLTPPSRAR
jgi:hypothetical protein